MKKILILAFALWGWSAHAQVFQKGQSVVHGGVVYNAELNNLYFDYENQPRPPAFHLKYEYALTSKIGLGLSSTHFFFTGQPLLTMDSFDFTWKYYVPSAYSNRYQTYQFSVVPKIQYHSRFNKNVNGYVGFGMGIRGTLETFFKNDVERISRQYLRLTAELNAGLRAKLNEEFQMYAEIGFGPAAFSAGLVYCIPRK